MNNSTATAQMPSPKAHYSEEETRTIRRKIGNTVYRVSVYFSGTSKETLNDKILRVATNDLNFGLTIPENCGTLGVPQTGRLLDGGSL